jgi:hypothetical protein
MYAKRLWIFTLILIALMGFSISSFAGPPVGSFDETYYNGIWNIRFSETCHRASDGQVVPIPLQNLYMTFVWQGGTSACYDATLYPTLQDARDNTNSIGVAEFCFEPGLFIFSEPVPASYVFSAIVERSVNSPTVAACIGILQGWLSTAVNTLHSQNKILNGLRGTSIDVCGSVFDDVAQFDGQQELFECSDDWNARWIELLPALPPT